MSTRTRTRFSPLTATATGDRPSSTSIIFPLQELSSPPAPTPESGIAAQETPDQKDRTRPVEGGGTFAGLPDRDFATALLSYILMTEEIDPVVFMVEIPDLERIGKTFGPEVAKVALRSMTRVLERSVPTEQTWVSELADGRFLVVRDAGEDTSGLCSFEPAELAREILEQAEDCGLDVNVGIAWQPTVGRPSSYVVQAEEGLSAARALGGGYFAGALPPSEGDYFPEVEALLRAVS